MDNDRIIFFNLEDNFIEKLSDFIVERFNGHGCDLSRVAVVFGGKRPALFLRRCLSGRLKNVFFPPQSFSMDEFTGYLISKDHPCRNVSELDAYWFIYKLAQEHVPGITEDKSFNDFIPWAKEIFNFIEQIDLEEITGQALMGVKASAQIGYDIPENINILLRQITKLRGLYREELGKRRLLSRGLKYIKAAGLAKENDFAEFDAVIFANLFYLSASERRIIKNLYDKNKAICVFQGDCALWPVLKENAGFLGYEKSAAPYVSQPRFKLCLHQGFDTHSQVCLIRNIIENSGNKKSTVVVLPRPQAVLPLLAHAGDVLGEFNVSLGYPLKLNSIYTLFESMAKAGESKKSGKYYAKDYLNLLRHPMVKNLDIRVSPVVTRVLVHKIEEVLLGRHKSAVAGSLFISLDEIGEEGVVYRLAQETLANMKVDAGMEDCRYVLAFLHDNFFKLWDGCGNFTGFSRQMGIVLDIILAKSAVASRPFNRMVIERIFPVKEALSDVYFREEKFTPGQMWKIWLQKLSGEFVSFSGSPIKGVQVLGLMETRSLNFDNVIIMDVNEGILPGIKIYQPLIPREVMLQLGIGRMEKEEEIQRYQFMRLIWGASNVHLIYEENRERERSRFIEELLWLGAKKENKPLPFNAGRAAFNVNFSAASTVVTKTPHMVSFLKDMEYSISRVNAYLQCPSKFYYHYVLGLSADDALASDLQAKTIGSFIHELLEVSFRQFVGRRPDIDSDFTSNFNKLMEDKFNDEIKSRMKSDSFLLWAIMKERMDKFLKKEKERRVERVLAIEKDIRGVIKLGCGDFRFLCVVDRVDELEGGEVAVIDYKTGGTDLSPKGYAPLSHMKMERRSIREDLKSFQLPVYYHFIARSFPEKPINAWLYNLRTLEQKPFICDNDFSYKDEIMRISFNALNFILQEIVDPGIPFIPDRRERLCDYCEFKTMCG